MNLKYMSVYEGLEHIEDLKALSSYRPGTRKGYIYVVEFRKDGGGLCKIGQTGCPFTRIHGMYYSDFIPTDILRFAVSPAHKDPLSTEQYLHNPPTASGTPTRTFAGAPAAPARSASTVSGASLNLPTPGTRSWLRARATHRACGTWASRPSVCRGPQCSSRNSPRCFRA